MVFCKRSMGGGRDWKDIVCSFVALELKQNIYHAYISAHRYNIYIYIIYER